MNQRILLSFVLAVFALAIGLKSEAAPETPGSANADAYGSNVPNAVAPAAGQLSGQSLSSILDLDGSIKPGLSGSYDAKGFRMATTSDGEPRFFKGEKNQSFGQMSFLADSCGDNWDDRFADQGVNGWVYAIAVDGNGDVYVGGTFTQAGGVAANYIAKWNGLRWSALGSGLNDEVYSIVLNGTDVYVGGKFTTAGGTTANHIAKWNGSSWSALSFGMNGYVYALALTGGNQPNFTGKYIYAGGDFTAAGTVAANRIARWDGTAWSPLGQGVGTSLNDVVYAIAGNNTCADCDDVWVGGTFATAGGLTVNNVAYYNGTVWFAMGSGVNGTVNDISLDDENNIFIGGNFPVTDGKNIAYWNKTTSTWAPPGLFEIGRASCRERV